MTKYPQKVIMKIYHQKHNHKWTVNKCGLIVLGLFDFALVGVRLICIFSFNFSYWSLMSVD
jgi:hypothetical protein